MLEQCAEEFAKTRALAEQRHEYETVLKRFYFTVTPLDEAQLNTWRAYLKFEEEADDNTDRVIALYERCIIPCCYYLEFWIRYARFLEKSGNVNGAREILTRCTEKFMPKRPGPRLALAEFEEANGDVGAARQAYEILINEIASNHMESLIKYANFERRQGDLQKCAEVYEKAVAIATDSQLPFVAAHAAQSIAKAGQADKARELLEGAVEKVSSSVPFWLSYMAMEASQEGEEASERVQAVATKAKEQLASNAQGVKQVDQFLLEYLAFHSSSAAGLREMEFQTKYAALESAASSAGAGHKRGREDDYYGGQKAPKLGPGGVASQSGMAYGQPYGAHAPAPAYGGAQPYYPPQQQHYGGYGGGMGGY